MLCKGSHMGLLNPLNLPDHLSLLNLLNILIYTKVLAN